MPLVSSPTQTSHLYLLLIALASVASFGFVDAASGLIYLPALLVLVLASLWQAASVKVTRRGLDVFLLAWALYLFASMAWSAWPQASLWFATTLATTPLLCFAASKHLGSPSAWRFIRVTAQLTAVCFGSWLLVEFFVEGGRSDGPLRDANAAAAIVNLFLIPAFWIACAPKTARAERIRQLLLISLLTGALASTSSRGALLALLGAGLVSVVAFVTFRLPCSRRGLIAATAACLTGLAAVYAGPEAPAGRAIDLAQDRSALTRLSMWQSTFEMYLDHPVAGVGVGAFAAKYPQYRSPDDDHTAGTFAHNDYLQLLAEGGLPLLAMVVVFGLAILRWAYRLLSRTAVEGARQDTYEALGLAAGVAAMFAHASVNFIFYISPLAIWIGIYAARLRSLARLDHEVPATPERAAPRGVARLVTAAAGSLAIFIVVTDILSYYWLAYERVPPGQYQVSSARYELALALSYANPLNTHALDYLIRAQTRLALDNREDFIGQTMADMAHRDVRRLTRVRYGTCAARVLQARLLKTFPAPATPRAPRSPETVLLKTLEERPTCLEAVLSLADLYRAQGHPQRALNVLETANDWMQDTTTAKALRLEVLEKTASTYQVLGRPDQALLVALTVLNNNPESEVARRVAAEAKQALAAQQKGSS